MKRRLALPFLISLLLPACVSTQMSNEFEMMRKEALTPPGLEYLPQTYGISPAVRSGGFLFLSGVIGQTNGRAAATPDEEFELAWLQIRSTLEYAGASTADIVEIVSFHTDPNSIAAFSTAKDRYIQAPHPTWTAIGVSWLAVPGARAEIKVVAKAP